MREIFVFGSNQAGIHGKGAALTARREHGAMQGIGEGYMNNSYAIPTKNAHIRTRSLDDIEISVRRFLSFARANPQLRFKVTRIGCGLAGYRDHQIAPLFKDAPNNCIFSDMWGSYLPNHKTFSEPKE